MDDCEANLFPALGFSRQSQSSGPLTPRPGDSSQNVATLAFPPCGRDLLRGNDRSAEGVYLLWLPSLATMIFNLKARFHRFSPAWIKLGLQFRQRWRHSADHGAPAHH